MPVRAGMAMQVVVVVMLMTVTVGVEIARAPGEADVPMCATMWMGVNMAAVGMSESDLPTHDGKGSAT